MKNIIELTEWVYEEPYSKVKIGKLAEVICITAKMGDKVSIDILSEEAEEAVVSVTTVANKLKFKNRSFDLVLVGGLFKCEKYFKCVLMNKLKNISNDVEQVSSLITEISVASNQQYTAIEKINQVMTELESNTQENSELVVRVSTISNKMLEEANKMKSIINSILSK